MNILSKITCLESNRVGFKFPTAVLPLYSHSIGFDSILISQSQAEFHIATKQSQQRRLLSDWLIVLLVPRFFHAPAREITNKMAAKDVLFDYLL